MPEALPSDTKLLTRMLKGVNRLYSRNFHRVHQINRCPLPEKGPAIVIANHISSADPFLIQGTSHRVIRWMMAKEYFDLPLIRTLCESIGFIPVNRSGRDTSSLKAALRTLEAGHVLGLFPEGRISPSHQLMPFQAGLGVLVQRTGAPVFPVAVEKFPRNLSLLSALLVPHEATVIYGGVMRNCEAVAMECYEHAIQLLQQQAIATRCQELCPY